MIPLPIKIYCRASVFGVQADQTADGAIANQGVTTSVRNLLISPLFMVRPTNPAQRSEKRSSSLALLRWLRQIFLRLRLAFQRRDLVGIDPHHDVIDVVVDFGEPVPGA